MKVFLYLDMDGHAGVYNVNTPEQIQVIFGKVVQDLGGDPNEIEGMELHEVQSYLEAEFDFVFDRNGGSRAFILDVKKHMNQLVEQ